MTTAITIVAECGCKITRLPTEPTLGKAVHVDGRPVREVVVERCPTCFSYGRQRALALKEAEQIILADLGPKVKGTMKDKEFELFCAAWDRRLLEMTQDIWKARYGEAHP